MNGTGEYIPPNIRAVLGEVTSMRKEIRRLGQVIKNLRTKKSSGETILYQYMTEKQLKNLGEITLGSVKPRQKRKPTKEKKKDAFELFSEEGIDDPDSFWKRFQQTQKYIQPPLEEDQESEFY